MIGSEGELLEADPLDAVARPAMPCDLCDLFPVGTGHGGPVEVKVALPLPPVGTYRADCDATVATRVHTTGIMAQRREFEFIMDLQAREDMDRIILQAKQMFCAEALREANWEVMRVLLDAVPRPGKRCGVGGLLELASDLCASYPYPQFPAGVALLIPYPSLAGLLASPEARVSVCGGPGAPRVFLNGVEAIAYEAPQGVAQVHGEPMPTYAMPRHGRVGLAMSKVALQVADRGSHLDFKAHCHIGAKLLSEPVLGAIA